jgi:hypothetical protein
MANHTVDDIFQILIHARDTPPLIAQDEIENFLKLGKLRLTYRIRGGAENYYHDIAPSEGLSGPVEPQGWRGSMMYLAIEDGHLVVKAKGAIHGFSWDDVSFTVDNWSLVYELWPPKTGEPPEPAKQPPESVKRKATKQDVALAIIRRLYPKARTAMDVLKIAGSKTKVWQEVADQKQWSQECKRLGVSYTPPGDDTVSIALDLFDR